MKVIVCSETSIPFYTRSRQAFG